MRHAQVGRKTALFAGLLLVSFGGRARADESDKEDEAAAAAEKAEAPKSAKAEEPKAAKAEETKATKAEEPKSAKGDEPKASEGPASVAVLPYSPLFGGVAQSLADKVTEQVSNELTASNSGNDFHVASVVGGEKKSADHKPKEDGVAAAKKQIESALESLQKGTTLAGARKFAPAVENLEHGISLFLANFQGADDFKALSDAYVQLATARLKLGKDDAAGRALDDLVRLDPERVLTAPAVPHELASRHARQRAAFLKKTRGAIRIDSAPAGARVTIDGRDLGETPLLAQGVLPGDHYVRVIKDGIGSAFSKISVGTDEEAASFTLAEEHASGPLAAVAKALAKNSVDEAVIKSVQKLGAASKADYVVFGGIRKNASTENLDVKSYAIRSKDGAVAELPDLSFDQEMLGANIEVLKLVSDLTQKVQDQTFAANPGTLTPFDGAQAPKTSQTTVVVLAPASAGAAPSDSGGESTAVAVDSGSRRRGPVVAAEPAPEEIKPTTAAPEENGSESVLEQLRRRREKKREDEETPKEEAKPDDGESGSNETKAHQHKKTTDDSASASTDTDTAADDEDDDAPKKKVKLTPPKKKKKSNLSTLTPEQLEQMKAATDAQSGGNGGTIALWTSVGVVGAAAIAVGAYFLFRTPPAATSATAHITWDK